MRRSEFKTLVTIGIIGAILAASIYGGFIDFTPSTVSADDDDELDTTTTVTIENPYDLPDGMSIASASYIIFQNGTLTCAKNGETGYTERTGTDDGVFSYVLAHSTGPIIVKPGVYSLSVSKTVAEDTWFQGYGATLELNNIIITMEDGSTLAGFSVVTNDYAKSYYSQAIYGTASCNITVRDCDFSGDDNVQFIRIKDSSNVNVIGNDFNHSSSMVVLENCRDSSIKDNRMEDGGSGISVNGCFNTIISGNQLIDCPNGKGFWAAGIKVSNWDGDSTGITVSSNTIRIVTEVPELSGTPSSQIEGILVSGEIVDTSSVSGVTVSYNIVISEFNDAHSSVGIYIHPAATYNVENIAVVGNSISGWQNGINHGAHNSTVTGNTIQAVFAGIHTFNSARCVVNDNVFEAEGSLAVNYGILASGSSNTSFISNTVIGWKIGYTDRWLPYPWAIYDTVKFNRFVDCDLAVNRSTVGSYLHNTYSENEGYVTEATGEGMIALGASSANITHSLSETPNVILVTPITSPWSTATYTGGFLVSNITASTFSINSDAAVTADTYFTWYAMFRLGGYI